MTLGAEERASFAVIARALLGIERGLLRAERRMQRFTARMPGSRSESAKNLVHYLALRRRDLRDLQRQLAQHGLSSLGRSEACVMASVLEVSLRAHEALAVRGEERAEDERKRLERVRPAALSWPAARSLLHEHSREVLGPRPADRHIYIMVTAPSAMEADRAWMVRLLRAGMNVLRINCAHETEAEWRTICAALDAARRETGKSCRIVVDLAGPKIRTAAVGGARHIATWKPARDDIGRAIAPARVVLRRAGAAPVDGSGPTLTLDDEAFAALRAGDELRFRDARGKKRLLTVADIVGDDLVAFANARAYVLDRARARVHRVGERVGRACLRVTGPAPASVDVEAGDALWLTARPVEGRPPRRDATGRVVRRGAIACTLPAALEHLDVGQCVIFDEGRVHAVVERVARRRQDFLLRVVRTRSPRAKIRAEKGINLPDTAMSVPCLTAADRRALAFVRDHADAVGLSFVRAPEDVRTLQAELDKIGARGLGVVLKIETRFAFERLPRILLAGLRRPPLAVMIARGDLAVEVGFERLAELQEEILWLCEAAHVPAIWATQVLDTLAHTGVPSRAEVTDAAAAVAAECVMLNKGPFVVEAVTVLADILKRMEKHRYKKRSLFRRLHVSAIAGR